ncbi:hypothetical protein ACODNH_00255 (plasmid) [Haloarcula sp. NS06]|uniref:hypothetical protein n=1 Tax=Haloarcula sp. NS06 TaxID=3409688 RepID=UPI003DA76A6E
MCGTRDGVEGGVRYCWRDYVALLVARTSAARLTVGGTAGFDGTAGAACGTTSERHRDDGLGAGPAHL